jgi:hypothetical protein
MDPGHESTGAVLLFAVTLMAVLVWLAGERAVARVHGSPEWWRVFSAVAMLVLIILTSASLLMWRLQELGALITLSLENGSSSKSARGSASSTRSSAHPRRAAGVDGDPMIPTIVTRPGGRVVTIDGGDA